MFMGLEGLEVNEEKVVMEQFMENVQKVRSFSGGTQIMLLRTI